MDSSGGSSSSDRPSRDAPPPPGTKRAPDGSLTPPRPGPSWPEGEEGSSEPGSRRRSDEEDRDLNRAGRQLGRAVRSVGGAVSDSAAEGVEAASSAGRTMRDAADTVPSRAAKAAKNGRGGGQRPRPPAHKPRSVREGPEGMPDAGPNLADQLLGAAREVLGLPFFDKLPAHERQERLGKGSIETVEDPKDFELTPEGFDSQSRQNLRELEQTYPRVGLKGLMRDRNRKTEPLREGPVEDVKDASGYSWNDGDNGVGHWVPQGITGQGNKQAVSWYGRGEDDGDPDVRIGFVGPDKEDYRYALLAEPSGGSSFKRVGVHAGGIAWQGKYMYVADTHNGFRVFDTSKTLRVPDDRLEDTDNYRYLLPQVGSYRNTGGPFLFSAASVDRSDPRKPALVAGEYRCEDDDDCEPKGDTRIARWQIDPETGRLAQGRATDAYVTKRDQLQGVAMHHGRILISSSEGSTGRLYSGRPGHVMTDEPWASAPEGLHVEGGRLWSLTEAEDERTVFSTPLRDR